MNFASLKFNKEQLSAELSHCITMMLTIKPRVLRDHLQQIVSSTADLSTLTVKSLRSLLAKRGWEVDNELWKNEAKAMVREMAEELLVRCFDLPFCDRGLDL